MNDNCQLQLHDILLPSILSATFSVLHLIFLITGLYLWQPMWLLLSIVFGHWSKSYADMLRNRVMDVRMSRLLARFPEGEYPHVVSRPARSRDASSNGAGRV